MTQKLNAELERDEGRGTRDGMKWEGEAPAEPSCRQVVRSANRQVGKRTAANSEWRTASSEWRVVLCG
ncbi:MAG: hypothetical protein LM632_12235, partial [Armatimonadetes bacterium]|nr:hypothetical protein [Armatimonadota bacterium]